MNNKNLLLVLPYLLVSITCLISACNDSPADGEPDASDGPDGEVTFEEDAWDSDDGDDYEEAIASDDGDYVPDESSEDDGSDRDGQNGDGSGCSEPQPHEEYCIPINGPECDYEMSFCREGEWICYELQEHPPPMPEFEDWAWRCEVYRCNAWNIPLGPGPDWQEEQPYEPPDPATLTGQWRMEADSDDIVPLGCERQPRQYANGNSIAVDPTNPDVIYVGFFLTESSAPWEVSGVFKSVDGGETWFEARAGLGDQGCYDECTHGPSIYKLDMDPDDSQVLFASTWERGIYRTTNGARTWEFISDLPYWCYWAGGPVRKGLNGVYHTTCGATHLRSYDGGASWEENTVIGSSGRFLTSFQFDERFPDRIWAGMCEGYQQTPGEGYLFLSDDSGDNWTEMGQAIDDVCLGNGCIHSIDMCDADPNQMAVAVYHCGLFLSEDGGLSWHRSGEPVDGAFTLSATYAPLSNRCRLYANEGENSPLYWTEDGGMTWNEDFQKPLVYLFFNPFNPEIIMGILVQSSWLDRAFELWTRE